MKEKVFISLNQKEQIWFEQIIIDGNKRQALKFLKEVIKKKVDKANTPKCKPVFEWAGKEPQILTKVKEKNKNLERRKLK